MKKQLIAMAIAAAVTTQPGHAAPTPREIHERLFEHLKTVRDHLVPAPITRFVEGFPPIAIPREKLLQLAQAPPDVIGGGGAVQVAGADPFQIAVPPPGAPDAPIDPAGIANWAEGFAVSTTQGVLDQLFPRGGGGPRRPVIVGGDLKNTAVLAEDLTVMMRILEKAAGAKADGPPTASGIALFSFSQPSSPRAFYLDGYGALFVLNVRYPLVAPPKHDESDATNDTSNSEWEKAKEEVYGRRPALEEIKLKATPGEEFNSQRVENLREQIGDDLVNAKNIRSLKPEDYVTVVVLGGGARNPVVRGAGFPPRATRGARAQSAAAEAASNNEAGAQSTMTLRAKKTDIDAFAKGKLNAEEFRKKVSVQVY
ncbi:MAG TPA: hypothetical protein VGF13_08325 [Verrucomicrobiae bacterium]|jgi:hypothetical protein